jgi:cell division protein FtsA
MTGRKNEAVAEAAKAGRAPVVAALDLGQSKVACFIMKPDGVRHADRTIRVAGASHVQSRGVKGGSIINMDEAAQAIGHAVERAERASGAPVSGVIVSTAIGQMASHRVQARVSVGAHPIGDADLARAIGMALAQIRLPNRRPIHVLPIAWSVDGARGVHDPRSMRGGSLGLDLLVVSMAESAFASLSHCLELAHLDLQGVAAAPVVSSLAALEEDEMDLGCVCIDMGGGSTSAAVWSGRSLLHIESVNVGGDHVTADIARGLSTSKAGAERLKTLHGSAMASANEDREMLEAPPRGEDPAAGPVIVPRAMLKTVIAPSGRRDAGAAARPAAQCGRRARSGREHRPDRRGQPAERRARAGDSCVRPSGASGPAPARAPPGRRRLGPGLLFLRRGAAARRLRPA